MVFIIPGSPLSRRKALIHQMIQTEEESIFSIGLRCLKNIIGDGSFLGLRNSQTGKSK